MIEFSSAVVASTQTIVSIVVVFRDDAFSLPAVLSNRWFTKAPPFIQVQIDLCSFVGQGNNAYIFPAVALATVACAARHVEEDMFLLAAKVES